MCRCLAYSGDPVLLDELLYKPEYSLIVRSLHSRLGAETTNGDGFGVGWYGAQSTPGLFHSVEPAWNHRNLRELATHVASALILALTFGLEDDPPRAAERAVGLVEATGRPHGVQHPIQMTVATTDGERLWAFRYSSEGRSRSLPPEGTCVVISGGRDELQPFTPRPEPAPGRVGVTVTRT
jgi:predicted glutamine amidotransferase